MLADLQAVGIEVRSVRDLVATRSSYRAAVPALIDWLSTLEQRAMPLADVTKLPEGLARALTVREARPVAAAALIEAMRSAPR